MARVVGGIGASHPPVIGYARDTGKQHDLTRKPINTFLHELVKPAHRTRFGEDVDALAAERGLSDEEMNLIRGRQWLQMVRRGVSFFVLERMAAVLGVSYPEVYAAFRGESLAQFLATRKAPMTHAMAGGDRARAMDEQPAPPSRSRPVSAFGRHSVCVGRHPTGPEAGTSRRHANDPIPARESDRRCTMRGRPLRRLRRR